MRINVYDKESQSNLMMRTNSNKFIEFMIFFMTTILFCTNSSFSQMNQEIKISVKTISEDYPALKTNLQIPAFEGFYDDHNPCHITARINEDIFGFFERLTEDSEKYLETAREAGWEPRKYIGETIFELHYISEKILSFSIIFYSYTLGAHGFTERVSYNFDLETGNEIKINDLFLNYEQYTNIINQEIMKQITAEKEVYFNDGEDFQTINEHQPFYIQYDGIVVHFGLYEIAPYVAGIRYFKIPFNIFRGLTAEHLRYFAIN